MGDDFVALREATFFGEIDKERTAIKRIQSFSDMAAENHKNGYYVAISGGKDSSTIQQLCMMSGVKCEFVHNHTTADYPETVKFVQNEKKRVEKLGYKFTISYPVNSKGERISMWSEISRRGFPTRLQRWCCELLKEYGGKGRYVITGVRWSESLKRKSRGKYEIFATKKENRIALNNDNDMKRRMTERCISKGKFILNPIIDWSDQDVWDFIIDHKLPYNPLYDEGHKRIGCVGCPMSSNNGQELELNGTFKKMYVTSGKKYLKSRTEKGKENYSWLNPELYYKWWVGKGEKIDKMQV